MADIVDRLRMWPAADGADGLSSDYVGSLMAEAADAVELLRAQVDRLFDQNLSLHDKELDEK